ncbi:hypothetical protein AJ80_02801 [Polytolypa hystricis UAMH7299]|uniref:Cytochrome c oxidase polypeptide V n=1 Tax=Polytolypa hystricis (strain UAMH7299) TaxID=1447883 RepID=A0A2B7YPD3_POLH7|nr:hypothetical protein AJ80_02801 [Polytolypa hystricis UAMH7299]
MSFRALPRALARANPTATPASLLTTTSRATCLRAFASSQQVRSASTEHAIANPILAGVEKRWEAMPPQEQAELWMQLRDRMKVDWHEMTLQEKKAAYWVAFGPHGPRAETPKGEGLKLTIQVIKYMLISFGVFYAIRLAGKPAPKTMTREWQEATNEYAIREKMDPLTGVSSEGYTGKGHIQSPPAKKE